MTDIVEQAQDEEIRTREQCLQAQALRALTTSRPIPTGHCLNVECANELDGPPGRLFCGAACADAHHKFTQHRTATGGRHG